jgi:hypothetical protein
MVVGGLRDMTGSYARGFQLLTALSALGAIAILFLPDSKQRPAPATAPQRVEA